MRISGNLDQDGGNGDGEKWRDVRCVFKVGLIQDLPLDWMGEGKEVKDDLQVFGIGTWSWWPHFLRGEEGRSTTFGVLMEMLGCPWRSLRVRSRGSWVGRYTSPEMRADTRAAGTNLSSQYRDGFKDGGE